MDMGPKLMNTKIIENCSIDVHPLEIALQVDKYWPIPKYFLTIHVRRCWHASSMSQRALYVSIWGHEKRGNFNWPSVFLPLFGRFLQKALSFNGQLKSTEPSSIWRGKFFYRIWTREIGADLSRNSQNLWFWCIKMINNDWIWLNQPPKKIVSTKIPKKYNSRGDPLLGSSWSGSTCRPRWLRSCQWPLDLSFASHSHLATRSWHWCPWCVSG